MNLSYSKLNRFETCNLSYKLHYIDLLRPEEGPPLKFGKFIHAVLEALMKNRETRGYGPIEDFVPVYNSLWASSGCVSQDLFVEGLSIVRNFVEKQQELEREQPDREVLSLECGFSFPLGSSFDMVGYIDRVDKINDHTIEIIDYKTNARLFTRDELEKSLQLSVYGLAAKQLWPWATDIRYTFWMLRHNALVETTRTELQLDEARAYVTAMGTQLEQATEFPPSLNQFCGYCGFRNQCSAYQNALTDTALPVSAELTLEEVAKAREDLGQRIKILTARKDELDATLKRVLDEERELTLNGIRYRFISTTRTDYPAKETLTALRQAGVPYEVATEFTSIDNKAIEAWVKRTETEDPDLAGRIRQVLNRVVRRSTSSRFFGS